MTTLVKTPHEARPVTLTPGRTSHLFKAKLVYITAANKSNGIFEKFKISFMYEDVLHEREIHPLVLLFLLINGSQVYTLCRFFNHYFIAKVMPYLAENDTVTFTTVTGDIFSSIHALPTIPEIYAKVDEEKVIQVVREIG